MNANTYEQIAMKAKEFNSHLISNPSFLEHIITKKMDIDNFDLIKKVINSVEEIEENNKLSELEEFQ